MGKTVRMSTRVSKRPYVSRGKRAQSSSMASEDTSSSGCTPDNRIYSKVGINHINLHFMKVSTENDNNFGYEKITIVVDNIPLMYTV
jgi:hypothetical protein